MKKPPNKTEISQTGEAGSPMPLAAPEASAAALGVIPWPTQEQARLISRLPKAWWRLARSVELADYLSEEERLLAAAANWQWVAPDAEFTPEHFDMLRKPLGLSRDGFYRLTKHVVTEQLEGGLLDGRWLNAGFFEEEGDGGDEDDDGELRLPGDSLLELADFLIDHALAPMLELLPERNTAEERGTLWNIQAAAAEGRLELASRFDWQGRRRLERLEHLATALMGATTAAHTLQDLPMDHPEHRDALARLTRMAGAYLDAAWGELVNGAAGDGGFRKLLIDLAGMVETLPATVPGSFVLMAADALKRAKAAH